MTIAKLAVVGGRDPRPSRVPGTLTPGAPGTLTPHPSRCMALPLASSRFATRIGLGLCIAHIFSPTRSYYISISETSAKDIDTETDKAEKLMSIYCLLHFCMASAASKLTRIWQMRQLVRRRHVMRTTIFSNSSSYGTQVLPLQLLWRLSAEAMHLVSGSLHAHILIYITWQTVITLTMVLIMVINYLHCKHAICQD